MRKADNSEENLPIETFLLGNIVERNSEQPSIAVTLDLRFDETFVVAAFLWK